MSKGLLLVARASVGDVGGGVVVAAAGERGAAVWAAGADVEARRACRANETAEAWKRRPVERELRAASGLEGVEIWSLVS